MRNWNCNIFTYFFAKVKIKFFFGKIKMEQKNATFWRFFLAFINQTIFDDFFRSKIRIKDHWRHLVIHPWGQQHFDHWRKIVRSRGCQNMDLERHRFRAFRVLENDLLWRRRCHLSGQHWHETLHSSSLGWRKWKNGHQNQTCGNWHLRRQCWCNFS